MIWRHGVWKYEKDCDCLEYFMGWHLETLSDMCVTRSPARHRKLNSNQASWKRWCRPSLKNSLILMNPPAARNNFTSLGCRSVLLSWKTMNGTHFFIVSRSICVRLSSSALFTMSTSSSSSSIVWVWLSCLGLIPILKKPALWLVLKEGQMIPFCTCFGKNSKSGLRRLDGRKIYDMNRDWGELNAACWMLCN